ncbi:FAD-dependent oxidoreductase [Roseomonas populi]|uniref:FAD-dependent oxidoreductase n=1 Tax=Roseomonas populi TaxID=3121582 RepID=A0ABT1XBB6_9PROT|nr:FAD-dependent oxidoreductase [Roseomonas pecuniae]MCR0985432.1 FAD-dependent oxidoreductase [Roseomonas pecuniae]
MANGTGNRFERVGGPDHLYTIALRALVPVSLDNALVAGRGMSATHVALSGLRQMPPVMAMGQAAGAAAALAAAGQGAVADLVSDRVRDALLRGGAAAGRGRCMMF